VNDVAADRVRRLLEGAVRAGVAPGMVAGWQRAGDDPTIVTVGHAAIIPSPVPAVTETWFDLASLTKPLVTAPLTVLLMREHALTLDTRVAEIVGEAEGTGLGSRTVRQLLTHTSGLPAWAPLYALVPGRPDRTLDAVCGLGVGEPGVHVVYSCPGFVLLGLMIERVAGTRLDRLFLDRVARPLGVEGEIGYRPPASVPVSGWAETPGAEQRLLEDRGLDPGAVPITGRGLPDDGNARFLGGVAGNAGLFGTVTGVLSVARSLWTPGALLTADEISRMDDDHTPGLEQARGLGWQLAGSPGCSAGSALDPAAIGHTGFTGTSLWIDPSRGVAMALLTNRVHPAHRESDLDPLRRRFHRLVSQAAQ
jgi:CubicO group peptidase (beta-lactamase class C family)